MKTIQTAGESSEFFFFGLHDRILVRRRDGVTVAEINEGEPFDDGTPTLKIMVAATFTGPQAQEIARQLIANWAAGIERDEAARKAA